ncbi:hypothetical protein FB451DRAFT_670057 [Mycena latifolia]|nr:hypothetical protein FB451DRAFT_670057 [Mycena latifolia]
MALGHVPSVPHDFLYLNIPLKFSPGHQVEASSLSLVTTPSNSIQSMDEDILSHIADLRAVGVAPIHRAARGQMHTLWQTRLAERVRLRNTEDDQLTEIEQGRRGAILAEDRLREIRTAALTLGEQEDMSPPPESRHNSWDWDDTASRSSSLASDESLPLGDVSCAPDVVSQRELEDGHELAGAIGSGGFRLEAALAQRQRQRLQEEAALCEEDARRLTQYILGITQRRTRMLMGMTTLPYAPEGFCYVENEGSIHLARIEEDGSLGSTIYVGETSDTHPPSMVDAAGPGFREF